ncbi:MAG: hypothetical protein JW768_09415 [Chitinispirillaceae bacterium]|nr:hypothetical protein [Chitinispirillaceae bacterium]
MKDTSQSSGSLNRTVDLSFETVPLERINLPCDLFDERTPFDREAPALFLPLIVRKSQGSFAIIDGCKRYRLSAESGHKQCACGIINQEMDEKQAGILRIQLNAGRRLLAREKLLFVRWLNANCDHQTYQDIASKLLLTPSERYDYEKLSGCGDQLIEAVMQGAVDPAVAPAMTHLSPEETQSLINLFASVSFSRQMQRELAEWLHEIAFIKKIRLASLLASPDVVATLSHATLNGPQKAARFHEQVFSLRFPLYAAAKKAWTEHSRRINPDPSAISFHAAPFFEKNSLEIRVKARTPQQALRSVGSLAELDASAWEMLIHPAQHQETTSLGSSL